MDRKFPTPYAVVQIWSSWIRIPYYGDEICKRIGPWSGSIWDEYDKDAKTLFKLWNNSNQHALTEFYFTSYASKQFWSAKTKYAQGTYFKDVADFLNISFYAEQDLARDLIHYGNQTHKFAAEDIANQLRDSL